METLSYVDQAVNSPVLQFITESGRIIEAMEEDVLTFIEQNGLNVSNEGAGLTCDPYGADEEVITDPSVYLDNNFDDVCSLYFQTNLFNHQITTAA